MNSPIDFTLLCDRTEGYAVHCTSEEDAGMFVECARALYPQWCESWADGETNYRLHGEDTVYTFDLKDDNGIWQKNGLRFGDISVIKLGYKIISFSEIYQHEEILESDQSFDMLFGGVM